MKTNDTQSSFSGNEMEVEESPPTKPSKFRLTEEEIGGKKKTRLIFEGEIPTLDLSDNTTSPEKQATPLITSTPYPRNSQQEQQPDFNMSSQPPSSPKLNQETTFGVESLSEKFSRLSGGVTPDM